MGKLRSVERKSALFFLTAYWFIFSQSEREIDSPCLKEGARKGREMARVGISDRPSKA